MEDILARACTDYAYLLNEEQLKYVAPPSTDYYEQAIWLNFIPIGSIDDYNWRHRGVSLISTFKAHKRPHKCGDGEASDGHFFSSNRKFKSRLSGAIYIFIDN